MNKQLSGLLTAIELKRELSIREFGNTDLYCDTDAEELNAWYAQLKHHVKSKPPQGPVDKILIYEQVSPMLSVEYKYLDKPSPKKEPAFEIHFATEQSSS